MKINTMLLVVFLLVTLIFPIFSIEDHARDLLEATTEMQRANYFTFVMLIKMSPPDTRLEGNVTFLMPNDRMLANVTLQEGFVSDFLLRHSIPSPLLFDTLKQFPSGTIVPSLLSNCMLRIYNNGRKNFVVNNVRVISPNICVFGSSIRCHGIDGVLSKTCTSWDNYSVPIPPSPCPNNNTSTYCKASPPISSPSFPLSPPTPTEDNLNPPTWTSSEPTIANVEPHKSESFRWIFNETSMIFVVCLMLSFV
ncbi:hypothetical protein TSUD_156870 [Trifolium subterraneum]|uniref:FAS1 domain-containing protein n=1 Tax=Trifolium subterraneum TaxID=3900 RepID=A0A2Z6MXS9_TRISU|nr:hypothetical protein TSUD_156870 [Trifolium subterraneum]